MLRRNRVDRILADLHKGGRNAEKAADRLADLDDLTPEEAARLLRAATEAYPPREFDFESTPADLVAAASERPSPELVPVVRDVVDELDGNARIFALRILATLDDRDAAAVLAELLVQSATTLPSLHGVWIDDEPRHADLLVPALHRMLAAGGPASSIYLRLLDYANARAIGPAELEPFAAPVAADLRTLRERLLPLQQLEPGQWCWDDDYLEPRDDAAIALDLAGYVGGAELIDELERWVGVSDPRLAMFAAVSLLRLGRPAAEEAIEHVAAQPETRGTLFELLTSLDRLDLMPEEYATQPALAEADMVRWLTFPTELARPPEAIELEEVVTTDVDGEVVDVYVFRFLDDEGNWLAGVSGPFPHDGPPTADAAGLTFSDFQPWESASSVEHAERIAGIVADIP